MFDSYTGNDLLYYNPTGTIPDAAVVTKGERRSNAFKDRKRFDATTEFAAGGAAAGAVLAEDNIEEEDGEAEETAMGRKEL